MGQDDPFRLARAPARGHDQSVPVCHRQAGLGPPAAFGADDPGRAQDVQNARPGRRGQALVERGDGVARLPGPDQGLDEGRPARQVYCDEVGHLG